MWGGCLCRFRWQVTKATTHTRLASYTIIENKCSLGEIKIAGRDTARYMQALLSSIAESSVSKWRNLTTSKLPCGICVIHETCKPRVSKNNTLLKGVERSFCAWNICSSGNLRSVDSDISKQPIGPIFKGHILSQNVGNYQSTLSNMPEKRRSHWHRGGRLQSRTFECLIMHYEIKKYLWWLQ